MSATNKTTNYELPIFIGTDRPTWLGDFNEAMNKLDTAMHEVAGVSAGAETTAERAEEIADTVSTAVNTLTGTVNRLANGMKATDRSIVKLNTAMSIGYPFQCVASDYLVMVQFDWSDNNGNRHYDEIVNDVCYWKVARISGNIFNLATGSMTSSSNPVIGQSTTIFAISGNASVGSFPIKAYFDGTDTIIYYDHNMTQYITDAQWARVWANCVVPVKR